MEKRKKLWVFLGVVALALFNYPLLKIANKDLCWEGAPLIIYYIFGVWVLAIGLLFLGKRFLSS